MVFIKPQTNNARVLSIILRSNVHGKYIGYREGNEYMVINYTWMK